MAAILRGDASLRTTLREPEGTLREPTDEVDRREEMQDAYGQIRDLIQASRRVVTDIVLMPGRGVDYEALAATTLVGRPSA